MRREVAPDRQPAPRPAGRGQIAVRVLVVEDDPDLCRKLANWLEDERYEVSAHVSLETARAALSAGGEFDAALVDLRLGDADGRQLIAEIRRARPRTQVLALSAFPDDRTVATAREAGALDVLSKPLQPVAVLRALDKALTATGLPPRQESEFNRRLGRRLRQLRSELGVTQKMLAGRCGITAAQLSQIELGKTATTTWTLGRLCGGLRVPLTRVFEDL